MEPKIPKKSSFLEARDFNLTNEIILLSDKIQKKLNCCTTKAINITVNVDNVPEIVVDRTMQLWRKKGWTVELKNGGDFRDGYYKYLHIQ